VLGLGPLFKNFLEAGPFILNSRLVARVGSGSRSAAVEEKQPMQERELLALSTARNRAECSSPILPTYLTVMLYPSGVS